MLPSITQNSTHDPLYFKGGGFSLEFFLVKSFDTKLGRFFSDVYLTIWIVPISCEIYFLVMGANASCKLTHSNNLIWQP